MLSRLLFIISICFIFNTTTALAEDFNPKVGNSWTYEYDGDNFTVKVEKYSKKINGYAVSRLISPEDYYGGGTYVAYIGGKGLCEIAVDVHDAFSGEYVGIGIYHPSPRPVFGSLEYGNAVGTIKEWIGYDLLDDDDEEDGFLEKDVWEVVGYEDVTVSYGTFVNAMKVLCKSYYSGDSYVNGLPSSSYDWEFDPSCSEYIWLVPCVGQIKYADYEGTEWLELTSCKVSCQVVYDPTPVELSLTLLESNIPSAVISGSTTKISLISEIENIDEKACSKGTTVDISYYVQNIATDEMTLIGELFDCSISNLAPGKVKKVTSRLILPNTLSEGDYRFTAEMDDEAPVISDYVIRVADPFISLQMELYKSNLPAAVIAGNSVKADIQLEVFNRGNIPTSKTEMASIEIFARPVGGGSDILLNAIDCSVKSVKPSKGKKITLPVNFPADIPEGTYVIALYLNGDEDELLLTEHQIQIKEPFVLLQMKLYKSNLPTAITVGSNTKADIQLEIFNRGNIPTSKTETASIEIFARPVGGGSDILLNAIDCSVKNLKPSKGKKIKLPVNFPADIPEGTYVVAIYLNDVVELLLTEHQIQIKEPFILLQMELYKSNLPTAITVGSNTKADIQLEIFNRGNIPTSKAEIASIEIFARPVGGGSDILLDTIDSSVKNLKPSKGKKIKLPVKFPVSTPEGSYGVIIILDGNMELMVGNVNISLPPADLLLASISGLPKKIYGYEKYTVNDVVRNSGGALGMSTTIAYYLSKDKKLDDDDHLLGYRTVPPLISGGTSSGSTQLSTWNMINPFDISISYNILVKVDAYDQVDEGTRGEANNIKAYSIKFMPSNL